MGERNTTRAHVKTTAAGKRTRGIGPARYYALARSSTIVHGVFHLHQLMA